LFENGIDEHAHNARGFRARARHVAPRGLPDIDIGCDDERIECSRLTRAEYPSETNERSENIAYIRSRPKHCGSKGFAVNFSVGNSIIDFAVPTATAVDPAKQRSQARYSITSSATAMRRSGALITNALAVLRLSTNTNLLACSIGRSAGFSPPSILAA